MASTDAVNGAASAMDWLANSNAKPAKAVTTGDGLANKETFLKLLVAQIRNQNPLDPQDGVQFLSQLAQFSDLEQTMGMHQELTAIRTSLEGQPGSGARQTGSGQPLQTNDSSTGRTPRGR